MQFSGNDEERKENRISGGNGEREPPVPIPNTEVKPLSAESTWLETARENRTLPDSKRLRRVISTQSFFLPKFLKLWMVWWKGQAREAKRHKSDDARERKKGVLLRKAIREKGVRAEGQRRGCEKNSKSFFAASDR